jgi:hypothetical protein
VKVYVTVTTVMDKSGKLMPDRIHWEDGREFEIDRIFDVRPSCSLKAGGQGDRYTVQVRGKLSYLYFERGTDDRNLSFGRWFVEVKN